MNSLTRIFHTDSSRGATQHDKEKAGDELRGRLYVILPEEQFDANAVPISLSLATAESVWNIPVEEIGVKAAASSTESK